MMIYMQERRMCMKADMQQNHINHMKAVIRSLCFHVYIIMFVKQLSSMSTFGSMRYSMGTPNRILVEPTCMGQKKEQREK